MTGARRRRLGMIDTLAILGLLVAGCGSGPEDSRPVGPTTVPPAETTVLPETTSAARWETVATLSASTPQTYELSILPDAIQWRVRWSCEAGSLRIETTPPPRRGGPLVDSGCPGQAEAFSIQTGPAQLRVVASGPWRAIVDQQVDTPLAEPLPDGVASATVIAEGSFYGIEKQGKGTARVYDFPDGRRILRFEDFEVSQNTDLFVWLSQAEAPRTSAEATGADKVVIGNLKSTVGNENYEIPADVPDQQIRSVVIWCEPVSVAYSAASLVS